jgi:hypothetical protein
MWASDLRPHSMFLFFALTCAPLEDNYRKNIFDLLDGCDSALLKHKLSSAVGPPPLSCLSTSWHFGIRFPKSLQLRKVIQGLPFLSEISKNSSVEPRAVGLGVMTDDLVQRNFGSGDCSDHLRS